MKSLDKKNGYVIHEIVPGKKYAVCKILNEYDSEDIALNDLISLLTNKTSENEILNQYKNKEVI